MMKLEEQLVRCAEDVKAGTDRLSIEAAVRAYDLLDALLADKEHLLLTDDFRAAAHEFMTVYDSEAASLEQRYDVESLRNELSASLLPLYDALKEARFEAAAAASLHEFAKEVYEVWQTSGIFARRRALRELRERAGFRLESHRIGNYVAKTFDLMNEAQARFAKAQQTLFSADMAYKMRPGVYKDIADFLESLA